MHPDRSRLDRKHAEHGVAAKRRAAGDHDAEHGGENMVALRASVARFLRRELASVTPQVLVGLHRVFVDPRRVGKLLRAHRAGAAMARGLEVDPRAPERVLVDPRFDWGDPKLVRKITAEPEPAPAEAPRPGVLLDRPLAPVAKDAPPRSLREVVGTVSYYQHRHDDFVRRHPTLTPPDYYLEYGAKYCGRFSLRLRPMLSKHGQAWLDRTLQLLQLEIEDRLDKDPAAFDKLEQDPAAFRLFAYESHPRAYLNGGLAELSPSDLISIGQTPDPKDLNTRDGLMQVFATLPQLVSTGEHRVLRAVTVP